ncbi:MAG TPA: cytochrome c peroxidase [Planctomycetaceae bacterium]|nr:cytochrome c peroxidase [Planctomycetaceae bacterium]
MGRTLRIVWVALCCSLPGVSVWAGEPVLLGTGDLLTGIPGKGTLRPDEIKAWLANPKNHVELDPVLPLGLADGQNSIVGVKENPLTRAKVELGRQLYFDTRLSVDNTVSCASCHHPEEGYGRQTQFGIGVRDQQGNRNSPVSYNRILSGAQFWDGRAGSLEEQAIGPIANPIEMGYTHDDCVATLKKVPGYVAQFDAVFGKNGLTIANVGKAIAAFERCVVSGPSPFDYAEKFKPFEKMDAADLADLKEDDPASYKKYLELAAAVKQHPMSDSAKRGRDLFFGQKANCTACHVGPNLADEKYHNLGIGMDAKDPDLGRYAVTKAEADKGAFKTPTTRNVALSGPYMHDGSLKTLMDVVEHYAKGGTPNKWLSNKIVKIDLTPQEKQDLVAFMEACTGAFPPVEQGRLPQ